MRPVARCRAAASTCSASACQASRVACSVARSAIAGRVLMTLATRRRSPRGARPARVGGRPGCCDRHPRRPRRATSGCAASRRRHVVVVDHGAGCAAPHEHQRHLQRTDVVPQRREVGRDVHVGALEHAGPLVAPDPAAVVALDRVVQHTPAERRLAPGRVELDRAGEDLVEALERVGPGDELRRSARPCLGRPRG